MRGAPGGQGGYPIGTARPAPRALMGGTGSLHTGLAGSRMGRFRRKRTSLGLDIGSGFVKIAEVDHGGDRPELSRAAMRPIPRMRGGGR